MFAKQTIPLLCLLTNESEEIEKIKDALKNR